MAFERIIYVTVFFCSIKNKENIYEFMVNKSLGLNVEINKIKGNLLKF